MVTGEPAEQRDVKTHAVPREAPPRRDDRGGDCDAGAVGAGGPARLALRQRARELRARAAGTRGLSRRTAAAGLRYLLLGTATEKTRAVLAKFGSVQEYDGDGKPVRTASAGGQ